MFKKINLTFVETIKIKRQTGITFQSVDIEKNRNRQKLFIPNKND